MVRGDDGVIRLYIFSFGELVFCKLNAIYNDARASKNIKEGYHGIKVLQMQSLRTDRSDR